MVSFGALSILLPCEVVEPVVVETPCEDEVVSPDVIETAPAGYKPYAVSTPNPTPLPEDEDIDNKNNVY
jgi:hypothetical protein